jgi:hypothetical protein
MIKLLLGVCAFCEEGSVIMDCPFVPFHIRASIARHVELQNCGKNINGSIIGTRTRNSYSVKQIEKHGVGKPIGTIKSTNSSIYSYQEQKTRGVFTSTFYNIEDTNG